MYSLLKLFHIADGGQLAMGVAPSIGYQRAEIVVLSSKVYDLSGGNCVVGERFLLFQS